MTKLSIIGLFVGAGIMVGGIVTSVKNQEQPLPGIILGGIGFSILCYNVGMLLYDCHCKRQNPQQIEA